MDEDVWSVITGMYEAYAAGDRAEVDARLDPGATVWDSAVPELLVGKEDLDRVRDARADAPVETGLQAYEPVIEVFGDTAVVRYWLRVEFAGDLLPELVRNTAVLRRTGPGGSWLIVHLHEDVVQPGGRPAP